MLISRGGAVRSLVGLITRRSCGSNPTPATISDANHGIFFLLWWASKDNIFRRFTPEPHYLGRVCSRDPCPTIATSFNANPTPATTSDALIGIFFLFWYTFN